MVRADYKGRNAVPPTTMALFFLHIIAQPSLVSADECSAILSHGITNVYQTWKNRDYRSDVRNSFCDKWKQSQSDKAGGGFGLGEGLPSIDFNNSNTQQIASEVCGANSNAMTDSQTDRVLKVTVEPSIVEAWSKCESGGLILDGDVSGSVVVISLRFKPWHDVTEAKLTFAPQISGAACPSTIFEKGTLITGAGIMAQCRRQGREIIVATFNADHGPQTLKIPPPADPPQIIRPSCDGILTVNGTPRFPDRDRHWCVVERQYIHSPFQRFCSTAVSAGPCTCTFAATNPSPFPQPSLPGHVIACDGETIN